MPLIPLSDVSPAAWFVDSDADWWTKVILGPPGFEAYARVLYDLEDTPLEKNEPIRAALRDVLARHTTTPDDCFFALWDGWGGTQALIDALLADPRLDAVATAYGPDQPEYR